METFRTKVGQTLATAAPAALVMAAVAANTLFTEPMEDMGDANVELQNLLDTIRENGKATIEQRDQVRALRRKIERTASKIPQLVGNKSVIIR